MNKTCEQISAKPHFATNVFNDLIGRFAINKNKEPIIKNGNENIIPSFKALITFVFVNFEIYTTTFSFMNFSILLSPITSHH